MIYIKYESLICYETKERWSLVVIMETGDFWFNFILNMLLRTLMAVSEYWTISHLPDGSQVRVIMFGK